MPTKNHLTDVLPIFLRNLLEYITIPEVWMHTADRRIVKHLDVILFTILYFSIASPQRVSFYLNTSRQTTFIFELLKVSYPYIADTYFYQSLFKPLFTNGYKFFVTIALSGVGFKIKFKDVFSKGLKPIALGGITWLCVALCSYAFAFIFAGYIG